MTETSANLTRRKFIITGSAAIAAPLVMKMAGSVGEAKSAEPKAAAKNASKPGKIYYIGHQCIGCQVCKALCPAGAIDFGDCRNEIDQDKCQHCGTCYRECPICVISETEIS